MQNTTCLRVRLFETLTDTNIELNKLVLGVPAQVWDVLFKKNPKDFDDFINEVTKARAEASNKKKIEDMKGFIRSVTFNPPYTTVSWQDGVITRVTCGDNDTYSKEQGLLYCIVKRFYENGSTFNEVINYWLEHGKATDSYAKRQEKEHEKKPFNGAGDKLIYLSDDSDVNALVDKIVGPAYPEEPHDEYWETGERLLLKTILLYMNYNLPTKEMTVATLMELVESVISEKDSVEKSKFGRIIQKETRGEFPGIAEYRKLCSSYRKDVNTIAYLTGMHVLSYAEREEDFMAKICPVSMEPVLYSECLECENRTECRDGDSTVPASVNKAEEINEE